jgi:hypothetical protein
MVDMSYAAIPTSRLYWNPVLAAALIGGAVVGLMTGGGAADPELALLLRFMAVVKAGMAVGAAAAVAWRMRQPVRFVPAMAYVAAISSMAAGAGLIWQLGHVAAGAVLVHGGLVALAVSAWVDRAGWVQAASVMSASMRSRRSGWPGVAIRVPPRGTSRQQPRSPSIGSDTSSSPAVPFL